MGRNGARLRLSCKTDGGRWVSTSASSAPIRLVSVARSKYSNTSIPTFRSMLVISVCCGAVTWPSACATATSCTLPIRSSMAEGENKPFVATGATSTGFRNRHKTVSIRSRLPIQIYSQILHPLHACGRPLDPSYAQPGENAYQQPRTIFEPTYRNPWWVLQGSNL